VRRDAQWQVIPDWHIGLLLRLPSRAVFIGSVYRYSANQVSVIAANQVSVVAANQVSVIAANQVSVIAANQVSVIAADGVARPVLRRHRPQWRR